LWVFDVDKGIERKVADPRDLLADSEDIPAAERARRERMREQAAGITAFTTDEAGIKAAFALAGQLFVANLQTGSVTQLEATGPIIDPRMSPDGLWVAWSTGPQARVIATSGGSERVLAGQEIAESVSWGLADFIASEELGRMHGLWWSPDSTALLIERCDESPIEKIWLSDPTLPQHDPREYRYPYAGTSNADVSLHWISLDGDVVGTWNFDDDYLVSVRWQQDCQPLITTSDRAQQNFSIMSFGDGEVTTRATISDPSFVDQIPGQPRWWNNQLLTVVDHHDSDSRRIEIDGKPLTPANLQVMAICGTDEHGIDVIATDNAVDRFVARVTESGEVHRLTGAGVASSSAPVFDGQHIWRVVIESNLLKHSRTYRLMCAEELIHEFDSLAERPSIEPAVHYLQTGTHDVHTAVLFPREHQMGSQKLPVLVRPYGGPHGAQVLNSALIYLDDQWFADLGFVVVVADGRGTPGRGPAWDRTVRGDFVTGVLSDQVDAVAAVAQHFPDDVDANRVGIMGWSFGGYLAALAVMDRPDIFHVAVAGAPVTEWRWYDTAYTERYLGDPTTSPETYDANSLLTRASRLERPLMLIHGLADDNVLSQHTLALSGELLAHGKAHTVLPLSGVSHMTPQEVVAENLMLLTAKYLQQHLA
jgi:dipeptidyl-peptidase-4